MTGPDVEVDLTIGQEVTLTGGVSHVGQKVTTVPADASWLLRNIHSSDPSVLASIPTASALARFRAEKPGAADVVGQSQFCLQPDGKVADCAVMHVVVR
jgi:hypothetical protein